MVVNEQELRAIIEHARILANYTKKELSDQLKMSISTFKRKLDNPLSFTLAEYFEIAHVLDNNVLVDFLKEVEMGMQKRRRKVRKGYMGTQSLIINETGGDEQ
jgi:AraC-like DNA-binding protein